jgi:hypothetical protein
LVGHRSPFWEQVLSEYCHGFIFSPKNKKCSGIKWLSHDKMVEFYDKYFVDDIPDEWSLVEKNISHGPGVLLPEETVDINSVINRWFSNHDHMQFWYNFENCNKIKDIDISNIIDEYESISISDSDYSSILTPVKKIKVVRR